MSPLASWPSSSVLSLFFLLFVNCLFFIATCLTWPEITLLLLPTTFCCLLMFFSTFHLRSWIMLLYRNITLSTFALNIHFGHISYVMTMILCLPSHCHIIIFATFSSQPQTNLQHFLGLVTCSVSTELMCSHHSNLLTERNTSVCPHI